jgi:2-oxoglutarate dehydrogenase E2 component (dihydrolipoamide succinyltransferase)
MKVDMVMPQMGESISEATILKWVKNVGDTVAKDEIILEISTDKVDSEIPAPSAGVLAEVLFKEGDVVPVKTKIAVIDSEGSASAAASQAAPAKAAPTPSAPAAAPQPAATPAVSAQAAAQHDESDRFYSPLVKSLAEKHGVSLAELDQVNGSGHAGRMNKDDFMRYLETRSAKPAASNHTPTTTQQNFTTSSALTPPPPPAQRPAAPASAKNDMPSLDWADDGTRIVPMDNMRQAIAEHMVRSKHISPHVYSIAEVDVTNISKWRSKMQDEFVKREGYKLSFTPFFLEAATRGILEFPILNSSTQGNKIIMKRHINLGCAVALGKTGLIVPVIKRAEEKNLVGLARTLNDLALRARNKKLVPDDVSGGTFTITNVGSFGTIIGYPIINQPQVAILALGAIKKRPVVIDDMIAIREMAYLTLSYDHRTVDGAISGSFLAFVKEYLENWDMDRTLV